MKNYTKYSKLVVDKTKNLLEVKHAADLTVDRWYWVYIPSLDNTDNYNSIDKQAKDTKKIKMKFIGLEVKYRKLKTKKTIICKFEAKEGSTFSFSVEDYDLDWVCDRIGILER